MVAAPSVSARALTATTILPYPSRLLHQMDRAKEGLSRGLWVCRCNSSWRMRLRLGARPAGAALCHTSISPTVSHTVPTSPLMYHVSSLPNYISSLPHHISPTCNCISPSLITHHSVSLTVFHHHLAVFHHPSLCFSPCVTMPHQCLIVFHCAPPLSH